MATQDGEQTFYEAIGGEPTIARVVHRFYQGVAATRCCGRSTPRRTSARPRTGSRKFLVQYWGGPTTYSQERGHPRLRMRHAPFAVTHEAREHWLAHFRAGLDEVALPPELDAQFWDYVERASLMMVNTPRRRRTRDPAAAGSEARPTGVSSASPPERAEHLALLGAAAAGAGRRPA